MASKAVFIGGLATAFRSKPVSTSGRIGQENQAPPVATSGKNGRNRDSLLCSTWKGGRAFRQAVSWEKKSVQHHERSKFSVRAEVRSEQKVPVILGPYKNGAMKVSVPAPKVTPEEIEKALKDKIEKKFVLKRINFTGSGAKIGHTVKIRFEGKYLEGANKGQVIKGTKSDSYELELKEREDEPWKTFVHEITKAGMGQEESKTFQLQFPGDYKAKTLAGVKARFTVTITEIGVKEEVEIDSRSVEEQRKSVTEELNAAAERTANEAIDGLIRNALLESSQADVDKVAASVTWAKFGERSLADFKWNVLQEEVARTEKITFDQVPTFLRNQAIITYT